MNKTQIPKRVRELVWKTYIGKRWSGKCAVKWCDTKLNVMSSWHVGHNQPESKGGSLCINNLRPICSECNLGMGNRFTIQEWSNKYYYLNRLEKKAVKVLTKMIKNKNKRI